MVKSRKVEQKAAGDTLKDSVTVTLKSTQLLSVLCSVLSFFVVLTKGGSPLFHKFLRLKPPSPPYSYANEYLCIRSCIHYPNSIYSTANIWLRSILLK